MSWLSRLLSPSSKPAAAQPSVPQPAAPPASPQTATPADKGRVLLIHGYSADGEDFFPWRDALGTAQVATHTIAIGNYITLNNEVTIKDLGEAFDRALRLTPWSKGRQAGHDDEAGKDDFFTFDAIVHSTGMLVLRQWLASDPFDREDPRSRIRRLKHLVGLAPATFGSPQAKQGRSWLGALVKGNRELGPDFLNAGNRVLDGLEIASSYTWDLAHKDMICPKPLFDLSPTTPYAAVFIGNVAYSGIDAAANPPGSDGTVRWAGCALNTRKVSVDLRREPKLKDVHGDPVPPIDGKPARLFITHWLKGRLAAPLIAVPGKNHGTIIKLPHPSVVDLISRFLGIADQSAYEAWQIEALTFGKTAMPELDAPSHGVGGAGWQQLLVHVVDDHGDPVTDYNLQLFIGDDLGDSDDNADQPGGTPSIAPVPLLVDTYSGNASFRCFYIRLTPEMLTLNTPGTPPRRMWLELIASSGSDLIDYEAYTGADGKAQSLTIDHHGGSPVKLDLTPLAQGAETLLFPYTTTLLELFVEREPMPLDRVSKIFNFLPDQPPAVLPH